MSEEKIKTEKEALEEMWKYTKHLEERLSTLETKFRYHTEFGASP